MKAFGFQPIRHKYAIFSFEFIKVWRLCRLRHDLSRNMTSRLAIKFPTPYEWWSNSLPPGQEKAPNARGMPGGGDVEASIWLVHKSEVNYHPKPRGSGRTRSPCRLASLFNFSAKQCISDVHLRVRENPASQPGLIPLLYSLWHSVFILLTTF